MGSVLRKMVAVAFCIAFSLFLFSCPTASAKEQKKYAQKVNWHTLTEGMLKAKAEKKPMLVDFAVPTGCPRCDFLQKNVYGSDAIVQKINADFIPIWVDLSGKLTDEEKALGELYDYKNDCLLLFLDYTGDVIKDPEGKKMCFADNVPPEVIIKHLDYIKGLSETR